MQLVTKNIGKKNPIIQVDFQMRIRKEANTTKTAK
jgi:hypothetical protein